MTSAPPPELYLDHNATTPMRPEAIKAMTAWLGVPANPSSGHTSGRAARAAVARAREQVAGLLGCRPNEVVFTSGATEANNLALRGAQVRSVLVGATEHPSVIETARALAEDGRPVTVVAAADEHGRTTPNALLTAAAPSDGPLLMSVMLANNETGVLNDVRSLVDAVRSTRDDALFHTDATQAVGRTPTDVDALGVDLLSLSGHKIGGPPGSGALYVRRGTDVRPVQTGGSQELGLRAGTLNVPAIAGLGAAAEAALHDLADAAASTSAARDSFEAAIVAGWPGAYAIGSGVARIPNTSCVVLPGAPADAVMAGVPHLSVSHGSACASGAPGPSPALTAAGVPREDAECSLRVSFGPGDGPGRAVEAAQALLGSASEVLRRLAAVGGAA